MVNISPDLIKQLSKQMNLKEIEVERVIFELKKGKIIVTKPRVMRMKAMGEESFQVSGDVSESSVMDEDVKIVMEKTGVNEEQAREALEEAGEDIAKAILKIKQE